MATPEPIINEYLANALRRRHPHWAVPGIIAAESTSAFSAKGLRPDIIVCDDRAAPVGLETEFLPAASVEKDAVSRLGKLYAPTGGTIHSVVAVRIPDKYRQLQGAAISEALELDADFEYCLLTGDSPANYTRWPASGFILACVDDLAYVVATAKVSPITIAEAAGTLEEGARSVAATITAAAANHPGIRVAISETLKQEAGSQTYAMTATILINAFVFQDTLAGASEELLTVPGLYKVGKVSMKPTKGEVIAAWAEILAINYWPIFGVARALVEDIPATLWAEVCDRCLSTADKLLSMNIGKKPDLVGTIFQRLISDRKFLATFYTAPSSAALMARLLIEKTLPGGGNDTETVESLRVADFACGTGSLLCAIYSDIRLRLDHAGVDSSTMHRAFVENSLVGCDVLPSATYITASQISSAHPTVQYGGTKILTLPFGRSNTGDISLGALDLLEKQGVMSTIATHSTEIGAVAAVATDSWSAIGGTMVHDDSFDIIAMNPPFTRLTGGGGKSSDVSRPLFAAFGTDSDTQEKMAKRAKKLLDGTAYHGNAGAAAAFVELGHRKLKNDGRLGLILPLSALSGASWADCRRIWRRGYRDFITLSIAADDAHASFSADTGMAETMIVGTKAVKPDTRLTSISLYRRPVSPLEGAEMAREIKLMIRQGGLRSIEDGPFGGTEIMIGSEKVGEMISASTTPGPWPLSRIRDHAIAQTAYQMVACATVWLPGAMNAVLAEAPLCKLSKLGTAGPYHLDISGSGESGGTPRGPFELRDTSTPSSSSFPVVKAHHERRERYLEIDPDAEGIVRMTDDLAKKKIINARADSIWETRTKLHFATDVQFNSNALVVCITSRPAIGGRAWPSFRLNDRRYERVVAIWFNSTLGILSFWWSANKTQDGRGSVTTSRLEEMTSIDPTNLNEATLVEVDQFFETFKLKSFLDIHECAVDEARAEIDRFVADKLLGAGDKLQRVSTTRSGCGTARPLKIKWSREAELGSSAEVNIGYKRNQEGLQSFLSMRRRKRKEGVGSFASDISGRT